MIYLKRIEHKLTLSHAFYTFFLDQIFQINIQGLPTHSDKFAEFIETFATFNKLLKYPIPLF